jgi:riboflavin kinase/FMN adenylyltransferase
LLEKLASKILSFPPLTNFSRLTAEEFVSTILVDRFHIQENNYWPRPPSLTKSNANIDDIAFGKQYDFEVEQISVQEIMKFP